MYQTVLAHDPLWQDSAPRETCGRSVRQQKWMRVFRTPPILGPSFASAASIWLGSRPPKISRPSDNSIRNCGLRWPVPLTASFLLLCFLCCLLLFLLVVFVFL